MVAPLVDKPVLKAIALQFLLAHAEQPSLLQSAREAHLRKWAQKPPFYDDFIKTVQQKVGYDEKRLMNSNSFIPDADFKAILNCFKELSGLYNPSHYTILARIVPSIGNAVTQLASLAAGPAGVISLSSRYNNDFNNDQALIIEKLNREEGIVQATIQHYFLPRPANNPPYLEKVTAALGYWEGIPSLWGYPILGETKLKDVQIPLEHLITHEYNYLNFSFQEENGLIYLNQTQIGKRLKLPVDLLALSNLLHEEYLERELSEYHPIEITTDMVVNNELIFAKGVRYGMPCNRYDVRIPEVNLSRKITLIFDRLWQSLFSSSQKNRIKIHRSAASILSETMYTAQHAEEERLLAIADAERERANTAQLRADAAEAKLTLEQNVSGVNRVFGEARALAHDNKNHALTLRSEAALLFQNALRSSPEYYVKYASLFSPTEDTTQRIQQLLNEPALPLILKQTAQYFKETLETLTLMIENDRSIMSGGIPIDIQPHLYGTIMKPVVEPLQKIYNTVKVEYNPNLDIHINADARLLKVALTNLVSNAIEASAPSGYIKIDVKQRKKGERLFTILDIVQSGYLSEEHAQKLNQGLPFTTKTEGNATGAQASYTIIKDTHRGDVTYSPTLKDDDGKIIENASLRIYI